MKKYLVLSLVLLVISLSSFASTLKVKGHVYDKNNEPIIGASVFWENAKMGVVTDEQGYFEISGTKNDHMLSASYIGYNLKTIHIHDHSDTQKIVLEESAELSEVVVTKFVPGRLKNRIDAIQSEKITAKELTRAACCNLSESFETNPSTDISYSDAVTGAKQIQLLGLSGTYVQMLTENFPNFRGVARPYGMDYIPGPWMESIQVSKGAASVKNGYESLSGQINVEYKKPKTADPLSLNVFLSDANRYEANADGAIEINDKLSTGLFLHYSNEEKGHDDNNDGFLDMPKKHQFNLMNRWHYQTDKFISQSGFKILNDERVSGQTSHTVTDDYQHDLFNIGIKTNRGELFTKNGFILNPEKGESVALILSSSYHDQKSNYAKNKLNVYQTNLYGSLMYERNFGLAHKLSTGLSMNWDQLNQTIDIAQLTMGDQPTRETTSGAYAEYTFTKDDKFTALVGLRADHSSLFNWFVTPRMHVKYSPTEWLSLRGSAGKGYRTVFALPENGYFLASSRKINIADNLDQEAAWNYGLSSTFSIPIKGEELSIVAEWYRTDFSKQVVMDMMSDAHAVNFYNLEGDSYANSYQIEASYPVYKGFNVLAAYRWTDAKTTYGGELQRKPLVSRYKAMITASYETPLKKWQFDFTTQFNGGGTMPNPDKANPMWDTHFRSFTILNAQVTKFFKTWSVYLGGENLTGFEQKNPIISADNPFSPNFDATMVWGPTQGRKFYVGFRYSLGK